MAAWLCTVAPQATAGRTESYCRGYVRVLLACRMELTVWRGGYFCGSYDSFFEED